MQSREAFRRLRLRLSGKAEEAVRKNCLPGAALSCGGAPKAGVRFLLPGAADARFAKEAYFQNP
ncbi:MAG: hypothetical protein DBY17_09245 [Oscillospiraceae bacterium]|nr:MAG: hypothetical protein DBY17_09245 [Oscillospiraceae bacterium]